MEISAFRRNATPFSLQKIKLTQFVASNFWFSVQCLQNTSLPDFWFCRKYRVMQCNMQQTPRLCFICKRCHCPIFHLFGGLPLVDCPPLLTRHINVIPPMYGSLLHHKLYVKNQVILKIKALKIKRKLKSNPYKACICIQGDNFQSVT
jgi:hypothetical protein